MANDAVDTRGVSLGVGSTGRCNLNCEHCYSKPLRQYTLTLEEMLTLVEGKNIVSINFGTGENILNEDFIKAIEAFYERGIKLSLTSNGYSIIRLSDEHLRMFNDLDISLDYADEERQNDFRHGKSWSYVDAAIKKCRRLGIEFSVTTALMNVNYKEIPKLLGRAAKEDCNLRLNIFKPVPSAGIYQFQLSYEQFWEAMGLLFTHGELVSCSEPIVNAMLGIPPIVLQSPCGKNSLRVHPNGEIVPCVYWTESKTRIEDIAQSFGPAFDSKPFKDIAAIPDYCRTHCDKVDICGGGCASRRFLNGGLQEPDTYCPVYRGREIPPIPVTLCDTKKDLVHSAYLCTLIFRGKNGGNGNGHVT